MPSLITLCSCSSSAAASSKRCRSVSARECSCQSGTASITSIVKPALRARLACWTHSYGDEQLHAVRRTRSSTSARGKQVRMSIVPAKGSQARRSRRCRPSVVKMPGGSPLVTTPAPQATTRASGPSSSSGEGGIRTSIMLIVGVAKLPDQGRKSSGPPFGVLRPWPSRVARIRLAARRDREGSACRESG